MLDFPLYSHVSAADLDAGLGAAVAAGQVAFEPGPGAVGVISAPDDSHLYDPVGRRKMLAVALPTRGDWLNLTAGDAWRAAERGDFRLGFRAAPDAPPAPPARPETWGSHRVALEAATRVGPIGPGPLPEFLTRDFYGVPTVSTGSAAPNPTAFPKALIDSVTGADSTSPADEAV